VVPAVVSIIGGVAARLAAVTIPARPTVVIIPARPAAVTIMAPARETWRIHGFRGVSRLRLILETYSILV
jgi:hypothetical protein